MARQRYSKKESWNRILRTMEGKAPNSDQPDTLPPEVLSEDEALSDFAELLAGSLPNESLAINIVPKYGNMFAFNATGTVRIAATDVYYPVSGGFRTGLLGYFTFSEAMHLKPTYAGRYMIDWSMSLMFLTGSSQEVEAGAMLDGVVISGSASHEQIVNANVPRSLAGNVIADLSANSLLGLCVANHTAANAIRMEHANLSVFLIAPYGG